jgi:hypothetical protein
MRNAGLRSCTTSMWARPFRRGKRNDCFCGGGIALRSGRVKDGASSPRHVQRPIADQFDHRRSGLRENRRAGRTISPAAPIRVVGDPAVKEQRPQPGNCRLGSVQRRFGRLPAPYGLRRDRSGPGSSPWSTPQRSLSRTSPLSPRTHRLPRGRAVVSANRRSDRRGCRST